MKLDAALSKLGDTAQIRSSSLGDIYSNSNKPTGVFAKIRMAFTAVFRSRTTAESFREGYRATHQMIKSEMGDKVAIKFDNEFGSRLRSGSPLTVEKVRSFISRESNCVSELHSKVASLRGDSSGFCDVLTSIFEKIQIKKEYVPKNDFLIPLTRLESHTTRDSLATLLKNFGLQEQEGNINKPAAGVFSETLEAIRNWGQAQAEFSLSEKRGIPLSDDKIKKLTNMQNKAYLQFEKQLAEVPKQRQAVLDAGALIRELSSNGQQVAEGFIKTPQLSQKSYEVLQILHEKTPPGR